MSKSWQTFDGKMRNLKQHTQLIDLALTISQKKCAKIRKCDNSKGSIRLDLGDKENNHLHLNHPNDVKNVNRIFAFSRSKINEQVVVEVYRIFTDYMVHILREIFASSPKRLLSLASNKDDKQMSFMEILNAGTYDELQDQMSLKIYRSLERQKSTPKLLEKFIRVSGININQDLKRKALLFLEIRHLIIHNNSKADEKSTQMNNEGLVSVNTRNRKITINFYLVNSAINSVFALCKAIDQELERVGLV